MERVRGLAWDDEPEDFMNRLRRRLSALRIELEVEEDHGRFLERFDNGHFDFVVLDLFDETRSSSEVGAKLATHISRAMAHKPWYPVFVVTNKLERLNSNSFEALPPGAMLRYKADAVFIARLIEEDLKRRGALVDRNQVFLIRSVADAEADQLRSWLSEPPRSIKVVTGEPTTSRGEHLSDLMNKMRESAGIIAVCAKDHSARLANGEYRTRPNIILEIGMALSLPGGLEERLVILKSAEVERPANIAGILTHDYGESPLECKEALLKRLQANGIGLRASPTN
jgi:predicted nucleotide-binding protein